MHPYSPHTEQDIQEMLRTIEVQSVGDLFDDIPKQVRLNRDLNIDNGLSELELKKKVKQLAAMNLGTEDLTCFLGAGVYDHYIPSVIKHLASRSEFSTAYTPYQPELSQGTLQVIYEYQTMICQLTGMDVSNASLYDGATACAEAAFMAHASTRRKTIIVSKTVHPMTRKVLKTYLTYKGLNMIEIDEYQGTTDLSHLKQAVNKDTAAVIIQSPNFFGLIEDMSDIESWVHGHKGLLIMSVDPISLALLKSPSEYGADIVVGEGQSLGNTLSYGGPYLGFISCTKKLMRKLPGRVVGETSDIENKRAFVLTLQAREQHIRREKATSNITSNQALNALMAAVYLTTMGRQGLKKVAQLCVQKSHYAAKHIQALPDYQMVFDKPFFKEFVVKTTVDSRTVNDKLLNKGILGGYDLGDTYDRYEQCLLFCVTEKRTRSEIDHLVRELEGIK